MTVRLARLGDCLPLMLQRDSHGTVTVSRNETAINGWSTDALLQQFFGIRTSPWIMDEA